MSAVEIQERLHQLHAERALAQLNGLNGCEAYVGDLEDEISAVSAAYVGAAVTEIASLRATLSGAQVG